MCEDGSVPDTWSLDDTDVADYVVGSPRWRKCQRAHSLKRASGRVLRARAGAGAY